MPNATASDLGVPEGTPPQMPRIGASVRWLSGPLARWRSATLAAPPYLQFVWRSRSQLVRMRY
eukprot:3333084-Pleurochrysis_carterae.AAC.1